MKKNNTFEMLKNISNSKLNFETWDALLLNSTLESYQDSPDIIFDLPENFNYHWYLCGSEKSSIVEVFHQGYIEVFSCHKDLAPATCLARFYDEFEASSDDTVSFVSDKLLELMSQNIVLHW